MAERFVQGRADVGDRTGDAFVVGIAIAEDEMGVPAREGTGRFRVIDVAAVNQQFRAALVQECEGGRDRPQPAVSIADNADLHALHHPAAEEPYTALISPSTKKCSPQATDSSTPSFLW